MIIFEYKSLNVKLKFLLEVGRAAAEKEYIKKSRSELNYMSSKDAEVLFFFHSKFTISRILVHKRLLRQTLGGRHC